MAGIDTLIRGAVGSLAKDKITSQLTPTQMELASFILNPQYYMAEKGINKIAEILGYGSDYRNLSADAKSNKEWYKEVMRDSIGDVLPSSIGDFVRATPRNTETDNTPAGMYYDPNVGDFVQSSNPIPVNSARFENTIRDMEYGTQTPGTGKAVGPLPEGNPIFESNVSNLPYEIKSTPVSGAPEGFDPALLAAVIRDANTTGTGATDDLGEVTVVDQKTPSGGGDLSYTEMIDILNSSPAYGPNPNMNVSATKSFAPMDFGGAMDYSDVFGSSYGDFGGGGGSKGNIEDYSYSQYRYGGQIHRGRR